MFVRSEEGLSSEHLFHDVDFVIYCEGSEVDGEGASLDEMFWSKVFSYHGRSVFCKSMGSKTVLRPLAEKVIEDNLSNILVAMDRDYEDFTGRSLHDRRVLYTFGYSWESDVFLEFNFESVLALFANVVQRRRIHDDYLSFIEGQASVLKRLTALDVKYIGHSAALFDREKPLAIISTSSTSEPSMKKEVILRNAKRMGRYQTCNIAEATYREIDGVRSFYGKAVSRLIYHWFVFRTKKIPSCRKIAFDTFAATAIIALDLSNLESARNSYYAGLVARV